MNLISGIIALIVSLLTGKQTLQDGVNTPTGAAGALNTGMLYTAIVGFGVWLIGPGRDFEITLRGWEIWAVVFLAAILGAKFLTLKPPGAS